MQSPPQFALGPTPRPIDSLHFPAFAFASPSSPFTDPYTETLALPDNSATSSFARLPRPFQQLRPRLPSRPSPRFPGSGSSTSVDAQWSWLIVVLLSFSLAILPPLSTLASLGSPLPLLHFSYTSQLRLDTLFSVASPLQASPRLVRISRYPAFDFTIDRGLLHTSFRPGHHLQPFNTRHRKTPAELDIKCSRTAPLVGPSAPGVAGGCG